MTLETGKKMIEQIKTLEQFLSQCSKEEIQEILEYGEEIRARGERKKKEWWNKHSRDDFKKLLEYKWSHKKDVEKIIGCEDEDNLDWKRKILDKIFEIFVEKSVFGDEKYEYVEKMRGLERKKFIEEYLHDDILYSGKARKQEEIVKYYGYEDWKEGKVKVKKGEKLYLSFRKENLGDEGIKEILKKMKLVEGMSLSLGDNDIGDEGAKAIADNMKLKKGVHLDLGYNKIGAEGAELISKMKFYEGVGLVFICNQLGAEGAKSIAKNIELLEGMSLNLIENGIGDEGAEVISKMELKDGVALYLKDNGIGAEGAKAIAENMKLKDGVTLDLRDNEIGDEGLEAISHMELKEGVELDLGANDIGDEGAKAIMENMELKNGVKLNLSLNNLSEDMEERLKAWEKSYIDRGIHCEVKL